MREIKFRGRAAQGEWLYGDLEYRRATGVAIIHTYNEDGTYNRQEEVNNRRAYGFDIKKDFFRQSQEKIMPLARGARQTNIFENPEV